MKHNWIRTGLVTACLSATLTLSAAAASVGTVTADALRMRAEATTDSAIVTLVYSGAKVNVLEDAGNGWFKVSYGDKTGYMSAEYLNMGSSSTSTSSTSSSSLGNGKVNLDSGVLNIRKGPSTDYSRVGKIPAGYVVALEGSEDGWYKVTYNGVSGYVSGEYIAPTSESVTTTATVSTYSDTSTVTSYSDSGTGSAIVNKAMQYLGCPYVYGSSGPSSFDCSGFTSYIYRQMGYSINRTASTQMSNGRAIDRSSLQPGDLVFFREFGSSYAATHVGIYIGNNQIVHASSGRTMRVCTNSLSETWYAARYVGARRIVG